MKKIISLDFDNVLYDLESINCNFVKEVYGVDITPSDIVDWNFYASYYPDVMKIWGDFSLYSKGYFFDGDKNFLQALQDEYEVQIITASYPSIEVEKDSMILNRYGDLRIIHSGKSSKSLFTGKSLLVDDGLHNISDHVLKNNAPAIIVDRNYGWNQGFTHPLTRRAESFEQILNYIGEVA